MGDTPSREVAPPLISFVIPSHKMIPPLKQITLCLFYAALPLAFLQELDFSENRSKQRNDPEKLKILRESFAAKNRDSDMQIEDLDEIEHIPKSPSEQVLLSQVIHNRIDSTVSDDLRGPTLISVSTKDVGQQYNSSVFTVQVYYRYRVEMHWKCSSRDRLEPRVSLDKNKVAHNVEMRDADKTTSIGEEKLSLSKSNLDDIKSYVKTYVAQYPLHESEKSIPDREGDPSQSLNEYKMNTKSDNIIDDAGQSSKVGGNEAGAEECLKVAQYPLHESEKGIPDREGNSPQSLNEYKMDAKSDNVVDDAGQSSKVGGNEAGAEKGLKDSEEALHNTDEDLSKAITLYIRPSPAAYPTRITDIAAATIDTCDRQGNTDSQCYIRDNDIVAICQVPICKTSLIYVRKKPFKRNRHPSKLYQSPFVIIFDFGLKDKEVIQPCKKLNYPFEGHNINGPYAEDVFSKFSLWLSVGLYITKTSRKGKDEHYTTKYADLKPKLDFVVAHSVKKSWFYDMAQSNNCWNDAHIDMVFYYLRKKAKLDKISEYRYTTMNCIFMNYIHETYTHYHRSHSDINLSSHDENVRSNKVASVERSIYEIMQGLCIPTSIPWHMIDEVYLPINCKGSFYWVLAVVGLKERCIRVYDSLKGHRGHGNEIKELAEMLSTYLTIFNFFEKKERTDWSLLEAYKEKTDQDVFDIQFINGIVQQSSGTLDCVLFVATYAEYLSDRHQITSSAFDQEKHRTRYASLLWDYGVNKACNGYVSDN
ncbi:hypothetical protein FXO38_22281 [Capsicum annuum]|nr:hypothetical protein FXO38_22281 [Capsicum annuum]